MIRFKKILFLTAIIFITGGAFAMIQKSGTAKEENRTLVTKYFRFNGANTSADYQDPAKWEVSDNPYPSCGVSGYVCTVSSQSLATEADIAEYLESNDPNSEHGTDYDILSLKSQ